MEDLLQYAAKDTATLHLKDAAGNLMFKGEGDAALPRRVIVYGPGTKQHAQALAKKQTASLNRIRKTGDQSPDEQLQEDAEFLATVTHSFENVELRDLSGRELALAIYRERKLGFIAEQVGRYQADWANFTPDSATS
jgi:hypothetical protein